MNDTPAHITQKLCELIRKKTPSERYLMGWSMHQTSKLLITQAIMEENPLFNEAELKKELFLRFYRDDFNDDQRDKILTHLEKHFSNSPLPRSGCQ